MTGAIATTALPAPKLLKKHLTVRQAIEDNKWLLLVTTSLFVFTYASNFRKLFADWGLDENYSHGYIVPLVFGFLLWERRRQLAETEVSPRWWGILLVGAGLSQLALGRLAAENFVAHTSLLL